MKTILYQVKPKEGFNVLGLNTNKVYNVVSEKVTMAKDFKVDVFVKLLENDSQWYSRDIFDLVVIDNVGHRAPQLFNCNIPTNGINHLTPIGHYKHNHIF